MSLWITVDARGIALAYLAEAAGVSLHGVGFPRLVQWLRATPRTPLDL